MSPAESTGGRRKRRSATAVPDEDPRVPGSSREDMHDVAGLQIRAIMSTEVLTLAPEMTIREAADFLAENGKSGAPVLRGERIAGVISASDILDFAASAPTVPSGEEDEEESRRQYTQQEYDEGSVPPAAWYMETWPGPTGDVSERFSNVATPEWDVLSEYTVADVMTRIAHSLEPHTTLADAARYMLRFGIHRVLVAEGDELVGIVTTMDFLRALARDRAATG
jgi:CBS domain-containing protein